MKDKKKKNKQMVPLSSEQASTSQITTDSVTSTSHVSSNISSLPTTTLSSKRPATMSEMSLPVEKRRRYML